MTREEIKQYLRIQMKSCIFIPYGDFKGVYYNNSYLRALKLSKITGNTVNKEDFKCGEILIKINIRNKSFSFYRTINSYLTKNYSSDYCDKYIIIKDVLNEYPEYNGL